VVELATSSVPDYIPRHIRQSFFTPVVRYVIYTCYSFVKCNILSPRRKLVENKNQGEYMNKAIYGLMLATMLLGGCATIVGDKTQLVPISSTPSDAAISIVDERGMEVFKGTTPTTVTLNKSDGSYWGGKEYTVTISKAGFKSQIIPIKSGVNGWYIGGNVIFGGLIGWFVVDPLNGAMYTLTPGQVSSSLTGKSVHNNTARDGSISIVLLQDVPKSLRSEMKRIN
jgi:hypothetical protein